MRFPRLRLSSTSFGPRVLGVLWTLLAVASPATDARAARSTQAPPLGLAERLGERWRWREIPSPDARAEVVQLASDGDDRPVVATHEALFRYDGQWSEVAGSRAVTEAREAAPIDSFVWSRTGFLMEVAADLVFLDATSGEATPVTDVHLSGGPQVLFPLEDGTVVVVTTHDIALLEGAGVVRRYPFVGGRAPVGVQVDADGQLWFAAPGAVMRWTENGFVSVPYPHGVEEDVTYHRVLSDGHDLWFFPHRFSGAHPLLRWDGRRFHVMTNKAYCWEAITIPGQGFALSDRAGGLVAVEGGELSRVARIADVDEQLTELTVSAGRLLALTSAGRLWSCDFGSRRWRTYLPQNSDRAATVQALTRAHGGGLWVGTACGVLRFDGERYVEHHNEAAGVPLDVVTTVHEDRAGKLWVGSGATFTGVLRLDGSRWEHVQEPIGPYCVHAIREGPDGAIWFLLLGSGVGLIDASGGGLVRFDGERWTRFREADGLPHGRCYDLEFDTSGRAWVGTRDGVAVLDGGRWVPFSAAMDHTARVLHFDASGTLWVGQGINEAGVMRYRDGEALPSEPDLERLLCGAMGNSPEGDVWIASPQGLFRHDGELLHPVSHESGAPAWNFWPLLADDDGLLWLGSLGRGLVRWQDDDSRPPTILGLSASAAEEHMLRVRWTGHDPWSQTESSELRFRWRVDGGPWSAPSRETAAVLSDLEPGTHRVELVAIDCAGNTSTPLPVEAEVPPPLWARAEFFLPLGAACLGIVIVGGIALRQSQLRRRAADYERRRLITSERHFRGLVEEADVMFASFDADGALTYCSPPFARLAGVGREAGDLHGLLARAVDGDRDAVEHLARCRANGSPQRNGVDLRLVSPQRTTHWLHLILSPRETGTDGRPEGWDLAAVDLSELRRAEAERHELEVWRERTQRTEAIGRLAGGISHDFNNLLTAILGHADLLREDLEDRLGRGHDVLANLGHIVHASRRAAALTRQLLAFGRTREGPAEVVDVAEVLRGLEPMLRRLIRENVAFVVDLRDADTWVRMNASELEQVVVNLVVNAQDAMPDGGTLTVSMSRRVGEGAVALRVADTGVGMDTATRDRIFEPFFTTKALGEGTGLGLVIVRDVVERVRGTLRVESEVGGGTSIEIRLPVADATEPPPQVPPAGRQYGGHETVLLCEDDDAVREFGASTLRRFGYDVHDSANPREALVLARDLGDLALLVTDVVMPEMSGPELASALREERADVRVLYVSGWAADLLETEEVDFLQKPFEMEELLARVRRALDEALELTARPGA